MGVVYKLREEVVRYILSERQSNPLASCRQLAESTSRKFGLNLSKSSVHDVLKESGVVTPRGRKPKNKFEIPLEKKKQIQASLSQVKLIPDLPKLEVLPPVPEEVETDTVTKVVVEQEGAGRIFLQAALWDLGIFSQESLREEDRGYYLTYSKGVRVLLENDRSLFIPMTLPLERCIRETADGLVNNIKPLIVNRVSDEDLFKSCMKGQKGVSIKNIAIVDCKDHILVEFDDIIELERSFIVRNRLFVEDYEINLKERVNSIFFCQKLYNIEFIDYIMGLRGENFISEEENITTLIIENTYDKIILVQEAARRVNEMYLRDEQNKLVSINIGKSRGMARTSA